MNVLDLWASPEARGLFHRAISQSPYMWDYNHGTAVPTKTRTAKQERQMACMNASMESACGPNSIGTSACTLQTPTLEDLKAAGCFGPWYGPQSDGFSIKTSTWYSDLC